MRQFTASLFALFASLLVATSAMAQQIPVNIESNPTGATVFLDNASGSPLGVTPLRSTRIARGAHTLIFRLNNHEETRMPINVARRRETFRAELRALGSIEVSAGNEGARGAAVTVDGQPAGSGTLGTVPLRVDNVTPGRHQIAATRDGYNAFSQWVDVQGGQVVRATVMLERAAPTTGSVLVTADVEGATIFLDGRPTGLVTTAVIDDVTAGNHTIEIRSSEGPTFSQSIVVEAGRRAEVRARIRPTAPTTGTVAILVDQQGALVRINGQGLPPGTYSQSGLEAGTYVVQVILEGYEPFRREVAVTAGQTTTVDVQLVQRATPPGPVNVRVNVSGAQVIFDGDACSAPCVIQTPEGGTHSVRVTAEGYQEQSFTCTNSNGATDCDREVALVPQQVGLRVAIANTLRPGEQARLFIDGTDVGPVPYDGNLAIGMHEVSVRADGYEPYTQQMNIRLGEGDVNLTANLVDQSEALAAAATTHSALPIPMNHPMVDVSLGYPQLAELRLGIGLHELFDAGFAIRTMGRVTEFEARARFGVRAMRQIGLGGQVRIGGGIGPDQGFRRATYGEGGANLPTGASTLCDPSLADATGNDGTRRTACSNPGTAPVGLTGASYTQPTNTFFFSLEGNLSLLLEPIATVTLWGALDIASDEWAGHLSGGGAYADFNGDAGRVCTESGTGQLSCGRQGTARFRLGGAVEFNIDRNWGVWGVFEGVIGDDRRLYGSLFGSEGDLQIYPRLGATYKF